jgi:hypothetical protein
MKRWDAEAAKALSPRYDPRPNDPHANAPAQLTPRQHPGDDGDRHRLKQSAGRRRAVARAEQNQANAADPETGEITQP